MLHLVNGEATLHLLRDAQLPGDARSVDDVLMDGPITNGLEDASDWTARAAWLDARLGIPKADYLVAHARIERALRAATQADEVVVWSEEDLFCQTNLAYLLHRLRATGANVSLVCPPTVRLGRVPSADYHELFLQRAPVDAARFEAATTAWRAIASQDPRDVERAAANLDATAPGVAAALRLHLARYPSTRNGLGALDDALLDTVRQHPGKFRDVFQHATKRPDVHAYGIGDAQAHARLRHMAEGEAPLVTPDDPRATHDATSDGVWAVTDAGARVLAGDADAVTLRGADDWIGGVRLDGGRVWRWDEGRVVLVAP